MSDPLRDDVPGGKTTPSEGSISATMMIAAVGLAIGLVVIALVVLGVLARPAAGQEPIPSAGEPADAITLAVVGPRRGAPFARKGSWTWLPVALENRGAVAVEGVLRATRARGLRPDERSAIAYERRVTLAPRSRRLERLPYFVREEQAQVLVGLYPDGAPREPRAHAMIDIGARHEVAILTVSRNDGAHPTVASARLGGLVRRDVFAAALELEELPDRAETYAPISGVLIADVDLRALTPGQGDALEGFVAAGGQLVVCFGGNRTEFRDTAIEPLLPVSEPDDVRSVDGLARVALFANAPVPDRALAGQTLIAVARPVPGADVLVAHPAAGGAPEVPLIVRRRHGAGLVTWVAFDLSERPVRGSSAAPLLGEALFAAPESLPPGIAEPASIEADLAARAHADAAVRAPSFVVMGTILAAYILLVVPLNYSFWRSRGRTEGAAPTAAVLGILAGALVYGLALQYKGSQGFVTEAVLVETSVEGGGRGGVRGWCEVFSPERRLSAIEARLPAAPAPTDEIEGIDLARAAAVRLDSLAASEGPGRRFVLDPVELDQWLPRKISVVGASDVPPIRTDLAIDAGGRVSGTVEAPHDAALRSAYLILGRHVAPLGDVPAGTARPVRAAPLREIGDERQRLLADRLPRIRPGPDALEGLLIAELDPDPAPLLSVDFRPERRRAARVVLAAAPVRIEPGQVWLPAGTVRPVVRSEEGREVGFQQSMFGRGGRERDAVHVFEGPGSFVIEFAIPAAVNVHNSKSQMHLNVVRGLLSSDPDLGDTRDDAARPLGLLRWRIDVEAGETAAFQEPTLDLRGELLPRRTP